VSVVKINAITVEPERADELIARFAARAGEVGGMDGFEAFELLKPNDDRNQFLVYTRWRSEENFLAWVNSPAFAHGHKAHNSDGPVSTHAELWSFEVAQHERVASDS
jgi:heme oxygenase (mycobilin-producing)